MSTTQKTDLWLEKVYKAASRAELDDIYSQWADNYDSDMLQTGYLHVPVIVGLLARYVPDCSTAILDAGVGTGQIGTVMSILGYDNIHGLDMSEAMLAKAKARNCYASLQQGVLGEPLPYPEGSFGAIMSTGTFTTGHAPAAAFDELTRLLARNGVVMFTVGTTVWEQAGFRSKLETLVAAGALVAVETTPVYRPMPMSPAESGFTTRAHVYRKT